MTVIPGLLAERFPGCSSRPSIGWLSESGQNWPDRRRDRFRLAGVMISTFTSRGDRERTVPTDNVRCPCARLSSGRTQEAPFYDPSPPPKGKCKGKGAQVHRSYARRYSGSPKNTQRVGKIIRLHLLSARNTRTHNRPVSLDGTAGETALQTRLYPFLYPLVKRS